VIRVSRLQVAPVKSLAVLACSRIQLDADGVAEDRRLFLLGRDGRVVTLRQHPQLSRVVPRLDLVGRTLELGFPDGTRVTADLDDLGDEVTAPLFGKDRHGRLLLGPLAEQLTRFTGEPVRVVLAGRTGTGWDEGPVSLLARASAEALRPPGGADTVGRRFRMLIEVEGPAAYEEESWVDREVRLGGAVVHITHPLDRCVVVNHDPGTGRRDWPGLARLAAREGMGRPTLGVIAGVDLPGVVALGDTVEVLDHAAAPGRERPPRT
jgi:uncharacterized protein YcbX